MDDVRDFGRLGIMLGLAGPTCEGTILAGSALLTSSGLLT